MIVSKAAFLQVVPLDHGVQEPHRPQQHVLLRAPVR